MSIANFFRRPHYTSDATDFIEQLKREKPGLDEGQRQGRALLWDKQIDRDLQAEFRAGRVQQKPYVYQTAPSPD
ncbi:MAG: DUF3460 family protein [Ottowia sp.]|uniref:DUF3460 family protein n=1 Tax=Ottowia sp. TaxID=1898956 RepID=UPI001D2709A2|nr:DUF3460 family protein [Ottowia sp.]MCP5256972.1 DUF3460 family protein [Burkholderiaceae bacterium]MCB2025692.1 DUF3460 family protein [Ottowia sp.]MCB2033761.1 DUF3460 family protein [Ottowia sp.]MCB2037303.1 DUF3460 family protein [Ottowia sp.]MCB2069750.1 DUF3460 family protein [Ottowia sp.]